MFLRLYRQVRSERAIHAGWLIVVAHHAAVDARRRARTLPLSEQARPPAARTAMRC